MLDQQWSFGPATGLTVRMASDAVDPTAPTGELDGYVLLDLRASIPLGPRFEIYGRVENVFDADYETAYGYSTNARAAYAGIRVKL